MKTIKTYNCPKCNSYSTDVHILESDKCIDINVKKCSNKKCKYQSGYKELLINNNK